MRSRLRTADPAETVGMETLNHAKDIYTGIATETRGKEFTEVAKDVGKEAENIRSIATAIGNIEKLSDGTKDRLKEAIAGATDAQEVREVIEQTADHLEQGSKDLGDAMKGKDMKNVQKEGDVLGDAMLAQRGSSEGDGEKLVGKTSVIHVPKAAGLGEHEKEHTEQAVQTTSQVSLTERQVEQKPVSNDLNTPTDDGAVNSMELVEAGAMIAQKRAAPQSVGTLARSYRRTLEKVIRALPDENRIVELARQSDGLEQFGKEARARKGVKEVPAGLAA